MPKYPISEVIVLSSLFVNSNHFPNLASTGFIRGCWARLTIWGFGATAVLSTVVCTCWRCSSDIYLAGWVLIPPVIAWDFILVRFLFAESSAAPLTCLGWRC